MIKLSFFSLFLIIAIFLKDIQSDRTNLKIYENIQSDIFCFRRLNATHQIGCSSHRNGNVGVLYLIKDDQDMENITKDPPPMPYIAAMPIILFNMKNMKLLKQTENIRGVLVFKGKQLKSPHSFSPDQSCPNRNFGFYTENLNPEFAACNKTQWNPDNKALGMMFEDWGMPVFIITNETNIQNITNCYEKYNKPINGVPRQWPLCSVQMTNVMLAAKDSSTCMRRNRLVANLNEVKTCDPLSDKNIINTLFPTNKSEEISNRSIIIVGARLDSFSMFDKIAPGAHSTVTGLVTLLTVAKNMEKLQKKILQKLGPDPHKNVLFILFNGEAFDYIGSSRIVYDMQNNVFPSPLQSDVSAQAALIKLEHISHFIELSQLAPNPEMTTFWLHSDPVSTTQSEEVSQKVKHLIKLFNEESKAFPNINIATAPNDLPLPPASFQSFLRHDSAIPGIVIADHRYKFLNRYYNSIFDTNDSFNATILSKTLEDISSIISSVLYELLTNEKLDEKIVPPEKLMSGLMECYLENASCPLFRQIADPMMTDVERLPVEPYPLYVGVDSGHPKANAITLYTRYLLAYLTGTEVPNRVRKNCTGDVHDQIYRYNWMTGPESNESSGICIKSRVMFTVAQSPAFVLNDWKSTEYSTWTESVWLESSARIFLQPGKTQEVITLVSGIIIFILSIVIVYFVNERSSIIFNTKPLVGC